MVDVTNVLIYSAVHQDVDNICSILEHRPCASNASSAGWSCAQPNPRERPLARYDALPYNVDVS